jgi:hypothetical protein
MERLKSKFNIDDVKSEVYRLTGDEYTVIDDTYPGYHQGILIRHNLCGHINKMSIRNFKGGRRCRACSQKINSQKGGDAVRKNIQWANQVVSNVGGYDIIGSIYINVHVKILFRHQECGNVFLCSVNKFKQGKRCPICTQNKDIIAPEEKIIIEKKRSFWDWNSN